MNLDIIKQCNTFRDVCKKLNSGYTRGDFLAVREELGTEYHHKSFWINDNYNWEIKRDKNNAPKCTQDCNF